MIQQNGQQVATAFDTVALVVAETLGIPEQAATLTPSSALLDGLPGLDSLAVVEIMTRLEERFGIMIDGEDFSAENFGTLGSLSRLVDDRLP